MSIWPHKKLRDSRHLPDSASVPPPVPAAPAVTSARLRGADVDPATTPPAPPRIDQAESALLASVLRQTWQDDTSTKRSETGDTPRAAITWSLPGFDRRCRVSTVFGDLPIEALRRHDKVKTLSGAYRAVERIDEIRLDADFLSRHAEAHPVQIRMRTFAAGQPVRNTLVSPAQAVCTQCHVGSSGTTVSGDLIGMPGICRMPQVELTYFRFHCGTPETVCIDGAWFHTEPWT